MFVVISPSTNPYFNLALEEYLFSQEEEFLYLWKNEKCIVVGKHQNVFEEINVSLAREHGINILRRVSGGGTVYHDLDNLNVSFIVNQANKETNFIQYSHFIKEYLETLGLNIDVNMRGDLILDKNKISGCSQHISKSRLLHHATLLIDSNLDLLRNLLSVNAVIRSKSTKSKSSLVTNINQHLTKKITTDTLIQRFQKYCVEQKGFIPFEVDVKVVDSVHLLQDKYRSWCWTFGRSPKFTVVRSKGVIESTITVVKGEIQEIKSNISPEVTALLINQKYDYLALIDVLKNKELVDLFID